jgi:predicted AAA+ superfamily ATPase
MTSKSLLRTVVADQRKELDLTDDSVPRTIFQKANSYGGASAYVVKGVRRCGKSTLMRQVMKAKYGDGCLYFNFDDERVTDFRSEDFQPLMETLIESYGEKKTIFLDEIQNVDAWELFINRILRQGYRVYITGSNANLLSKELGTHLTGRHVDIELYPFSFTEYLRANKTDAPNNGIYTTEQKAHLAKMFNEYLARGGMPEVVVYSNEAILTSILSDIIQKDISERYVIRKPAELKSVMRFLIANASNPITYRSITDNFGVTSPNTVQKYVEYAEDTYLIFTVSRYEKKIKKLDKNPRKVYCVDNGIISKNAPSVAERRGALLENIVAIQLKRLGREFYYFKGKTGAEADFVVPTEGLVIQVCYELNYGNEGRELRGLDEAMEETRASEGLILTFDQERELAHSDKNVIVKPAWQWLLENEVSTTHP